MYVPSLYGQAPTAAPPQAKEKEKVKEKPKDRLASLLSGVGDDDTETLEESNIIETAENGVIEEEQETSIAPKTSVYADLLNPATQQVETKTETQEKDVEEPRGKGRKAAKRL